MPVCLSHQVVREAIMSHTPFIPSAYHGAGHIIQGTQFIVKNPSSDPGPIIYQVNEHEQVAYSLWVFLFMKCVALPPALPGFWSNPIGGNFCFPSKLPYDVTPEQALAHEEVKTRLDNSIRNMRAVTDKFLSAIISSVDKIP